MTEKEKRVNMIKLFALGVKYANAGITKNDFYYSDLIEDIFDTDGEPATTEEIFTRLNNYEVNHVEECRELRNHISSIRINNETIELLKTRMEDLKIIG